MSLHDIRGGKGSCFPNLYSALYSTPIQMEGERMVDGPSDWESQSPEFKQVAIRDYARIIAELSRLRFDVIGSLYFSKTKSGQFEVGPIAWCKWNASYRRTLPVYDRGPWKTVIQMAEAGLKDNLQFLAVNPALARKIPFPYSNDTEIWDSAVPNTRRGLDILPQVIDEASASGPFALTHADLSMWYVSTTSTSFLPLTE